MFDGEFTTTSPFWLAIAGVLTWLRFLLQKRLVADLEDALAELSNRRKQEKLAERHLAPGASVEASLEGAAESIAENASNLDPKKDAAGEHLSSKDGEEENQGGPKSAEERKREEIQLKAQREEEDRVQQQREQQARNAGFARDEGDFESQIEAAVHEANSDLVAMGGAAKVLSCSKAARTISLELNGEFDHEMRMLICRKIGEELGESVSHEFMMDLLACIACGPYFDLAARSLEILGVHPNANADLTLIVPQVVEKKADSMFLFCEGGLCGADESAMAEVWRH